MGLTKVIKAIQAVISDTGAKVTLEWPDGTRAFISRHVYVVRLPAKPKMIPADDANLYSLDSVDEMTPEDEATLKMMGRSGGKSALAYQKVSQLKRDKIQGDDDYKPWIKSDSPD